jgi:hypothetical protein
MDQNQTLGMICGYFLSRFDSQAYEYLGFSSKKKAHEKLASALNVKTNSIKNWRDEFDPVHANDRVGWHQRPMLPSRIATVEALGGLDLNVLGYFLTTALKFGPEHVDLKKLVSAVDLSVSEEQEERTYVPRGPTGRKAEEFFIGYHAQSGQPQEGDLQDMREEGCGFDFQLLSDGKEVAIEVKGLAGEQGGISFTSKEWEVARERGENYYVALVRNVDSSSPEVTLIQNPAERLTPRQSHYVEFRVRYNASESELRDCISE